MPRFRPSKTEAPTSPSFSPHHHDHHYRKQQQSSIIINAVVRRPIHKMCAMIALCRNTCRLHPRLDQEPIQIISHRSSSLPFLRCLSVSVHPVRFWSSDIGQVVHPLQPKPPHRLLPHLTLPCAAPCGPHLPVSLSSACAAQASWWLRRTRALGCAKVRVA